LEQPFPDLDCFFVRDQSPRSARGKKEPSSAFGVRQFGEGERDYVNMRGAVSAPFSKRVVWGQGKEDAELKSRTSTRNMERKILRRGEGGDWSIACRLDVLVLPASKPSEDRVGAGARGKGVWTT